MVPGLATESERENETKRLDIITADNVARTSTTARNSAAAVAAVPARGGPVPPVAALRERAVTAPALAHVLARASRYVYFIRVADSPRRESPFLRARARGRKNPAARSCRGVPGVGVRDRGQLVARFSLSRDASPLCPTTFPCHTMPFGTFSTFLFPFLSRALVFLLRRRFPSRLHPEKIIAEI